MRASRTLLVLSAVSVVAGAPIPQQGPFETQSAQFTVGGLVAGGSQDAYIYWPLDAAEAGTAAPARNVVAFGHGKKAGGEKMDRSYHALLSTLASYGLVVLAPLSWPPSFALRRRRLRLRWKALNEIYNICILLYFCTAPSSKFS